MDKLYTRIQEQIIATDTWTNSCISTGTDTWTNYEFIITDVIWIHGQILALLYT